MHERLRWVFITHSKCFTVSKNVARVTSLRPQNLTCDEGTIFNFRSREAGGLEKGRELLTMQLEGSGHAGGQTS